MIIRIIHQHGQREKEIGTEGGVGGGTVYFCRFYAHFLGFCAGSAAAGTAANSPFGFISSAVAAAAALMSCSEFVVLGEEPSVAATAAGAIKICCSICESILLLLASGFASQSLRSTRFTHNHNQFTVYL